METLLVELKQVDPGATKDSPALALLLERIFKYDNVEMRGKQIALPVFLLELVFKSTLQDFNRAFSHLADLLIHQVSLFSSSLEFFSVKGAAFQPARSLQMILHKLINFQEYRTCASSVSAFGEAVFAQYFGEAREFTNASLVQGRFKLDDAVKLKLYQSLKELLRKYQNRKNKLFRSPFENRIKTAYTADGFLLLFASLFAQDQSLQTLFSKSTIQEKTQFATDVSCFMFYSYERGVLSETACYMSLLLQLIQHGADLTGRPVLPSYLFTKFPAVECADLPGFIVCQVLAAVAVSNHRVTKGQMGSIDFYPAYQLVAALLPLAEAHSSVAKSLLHWAGLIGELHYQVPFWLFLAGEYRKRADPGQCKLLQSTAQRLAKRKFTIKLRGKSRVLTAEEALAFLPFFSDSQGFGRHFNSHLHNHLPLLDNGGIFWSKLVAHMQSE